MLLSTANDDGMTRKNYNYLALVSQIYKYPRYEVTQGNLLVDNLANVCEGFLFFFPLQTLFTHAKKKFVH